MVKHRLTVSVILENLGEREAIYLKRHSSRPVLAVERLSTPSPASWLAVAVVALLQL